MSNPLRSAGASQRLLTPSMRDRVRKTRWQFSRTWPEVSRGWGKHASQLQAVFIDAINITNPSVEHWTW